MTATSRTSRLLSAFRPRHRRRPPSLCDVVVVVGFFAVFIALCSDFSAETDLMGRAARRGGALFLKDALGET